MGGGKPPSDVLIPKDTIKELIKNPFGYVLAIPLAPGYTFTGEELTKMEGAIKSSPGLNRTIKDSVVIWTPSKVREESLWSASKASETITLKSNPYIMGGHGSFWPLPLEREGPCTTVMWRVTLPESFTTSWLDYVGRVISKEWKGLFWTLSKRCNLFISSITESKLKLLNQQAGQEVQRVDPQGGQ